ncbi:MAG TPA: tRNA lysidine(34) synthetase TilS [Acidimicrobiales bacterium]|nr:tRNA lysidine(34) synthetase TilS [Acidimicrobiales bacterium]
MSAILADLLSRCAFPPAGSALSCAVSGGADSLGLLALATEAGCAVTAVHVDHGLRAGSAGEAGVVEDAARRFGARFRAERLALSPGPNLEARARAARLAVLPADVATGHTADDQAETMVLNLVRGAAAGGLGGMRLGRRHPILRLRRAETVAVCRHLGLTPVVDPTNADPTHRRNRVRHEVMPLLDEVAQRDVIPVLTRQAALLADEAEYLDSLAAGLDPTDGGALARAPAALARRAVRTWLRGDGPYAPTADAVERVLDVARGGGRACEVGAGLRVRRSRGRLALEGAPQGAAVPVADAP